MILPVGLFLLNIEEDQKTDSDYSPKINPGLDFHTLVLKYYRFLNVSKHKTWDSTSEDHLADETVENSSFLSLY